MKPSVFICWSGEASRKINLIGSNPAFAFANSAFHGAGTATILALCCGCGHPALAESAFALAFRALYSALSVACFTLGQAKNSFPSVLPLRAVYT
jgi:hypothetical protein